MLEIPPIFQIKIKGQQPFYFNNTIIQLLLLWLKIGLSFEQTHKYIHTYIHTYIYIMPIPSF